MTPAQQVAWIRDVPASCICEMRWRFGRDASGRLTGSGWWARAVPHRNCPWHGKADQR